MSTFFFSTAFPSILCKSAHSGQQSTPIKEGTRNPGLKSYQRGYTSSVALKFGLEPVWICNYSSCDSVAFPSILCLGCLKQNDRKRLSKQPMLHQPCREKHTQNKHCNFLIFRRKAIPVMAQKANIASYVSLSVGLGDIVHRSGCLLLKHRHLQQPFSPHHPDLLTHASLPTMLCTCRNTAGPETFHRCALCPPGLAVSPVLLIEAAMPALIPAFGFIFLVTLCDMLKCCETEGQINEWEPVWQELAVAQLTTR